jgi:hypothetical protein
MAVMVSAYVVTIAAGQRKDVNCHQRAGSSSSSEISVEAEVEVDLLQDVLNDKNVVRTKVSDLF